MSFDEMYDEMLHGEFSSQGKHAAKAPVETAPVVTDVRGKHAVAEASAVDAAETGEVAEVAERPRGFQRYRTAALVGAGGLTCAAAGAFLGGLGGYFTISPAAAHPLASPTVTQDLPLAQAVSNAGHSSSAGSAKGTSAVAAADFSKASGSLTQGIAPFATLTSEPLANLPVVSLPTQPSTSSVTGTDGTDNGGTTGGTGGDNGGGGGTTTGGTTGCASGTNDLGLTCILDSLTSALSNLGSLSGGGDPANLLTNLVPSLSGVVTDVTGTLQNLTSLLPIASLPVTGGGTGGTTVLAGAASPLTTGSPSTTGGGSNGATDPIVSALVAGAQHRGRSGGRRDRLDAVPPLPPVGVVERHIDPEPAGAELHGLHAGGADGDDEQRLLGHHEHRQRAHPGPAPDQHADHLDRRALDRDQHDRLGLGPHPHPPVGRSASPTANP